MRRWETASQANLPREKTGREREKMSIDPGFRDFVQDQLSEVGPITIRSMFGGGGVYADGVMFGLIAFDALYLKADETTIPDFESEGSEPFTYEGEGKPIRMSYWQVPERLYEDPDDMTAWAHKALEVARRAKASKPKRQPKPRQQTGRSS
jgi:DNA transformation protein